MSGRRKEKRGEGGKSERSLTSSESEKSFVYGSCLEEVESLSIDSVEREKGDHVTAGGERR